MEASTKVSVLMSVYVKEKPEYLTVAFDVHAPTFRHELYAEYKGTRKGMPDELREQVPVMKEVLQAMGILSGIPILSFGIPAVLSCYFDIFSGFVQALVFTLLSMVYISGSLPGPSDEVEA